MNQVRSPQDVAQFKRSLLRASRRILKPLVRILLRNGITAAGFQELARKTYVDVAYGEFGVDDKTPTAARVSVITGLNRKEVARLRDLPPIEESDREWHNRAMVVMAGWMIDQRFQNSAGEPLPLPFDGETPSFVELVKAHSGDMQPRAIADELLLNGALEMQADKLVVRRGFYVPADDPSAKIDILGLDTADFIETIDHNVQHAQDSLVQVTIKADNLPEAHLQAFEQHIRTLTRNLLEDLSEWLKQHDAGGDHAGQDARFQVGLGLYQMRKLVRAASPPDEQNTEDRSD